MKNFQRPLEEKKLNGFTLPEIIVVILFIAVMLSAVTIGLGNLPERKLQQESQKIFQKIRLLRDYGEDFGVEVAVDVTESGCDFLEFDNVRSSWILIDNNLFSPVILDSEHTLSWAFGESALNAKLLYKAKSREKAIDYGEIEKNPDIIFFSDGQFTPFRILVKNKKTTKSEYLIYAETESGIRIEKNGNE